MKSLRRSLNNNNDNNRSGPSQPSPPLPGSHSNPLSRPSGKVAPPQKVIKALATHRSTNPQELSYQEGDFWYVTSERDGWYEALNPLTGSRGLVPKTHFEEFMKGGRAPSGSGVSQRSGSSEQPASRSHTPTMSQSQSHQQPQQAMRSPPGPSPPTSAATANSTAAARGNKGSAYAVVQYDFKAERPDELDAMKGEPIVVIAQSNHEWFVAKPIGRLGGPGLIPVAFVEIRDPATGQPIEVLSDTIPMVEEWKKATADYKAAAIPLGRFEFNADQAQSVANSPYGTQSRNGSSSHSHTQSLSPPQHPHPMPRSTSGSSLNKVNGNGPTRPEANGSEEDAILPVGKLISLEVPSFHNETGSYWFRIQVLFQPDDESLPAYDLSLYRTYEDFYDFQITLLDTFPYEAGRPAKGKEDQHPPERILPYMPGPVDDDIDDELTEYRRDELDAYVKALIALRADHEADYILRHELIRGFFAAKFGDHMQETDRQESVEVLEDRMAGAQISDGRGYDNSQRAPSAMSRHSQRSQPGVGRQSSGGYTGQGPIGASSQPSHSRQASRGPSPMPSFAPDINGSTSSSQRPPSASRQLQPGSSGSLTTPNPHLSGPLSTATTSSSWGHPPNSAVSAAGAGGPGASQPPYVKIKIFDRATDDLIAIRVHPNVTYDELYEKVHARLGAAVSALRYKDASMGGGGGYGEIRDDQELRDWMRTEDQKLVLYAER